MLNIAQSLSCSVLLPKSLMTPCRQKHHFDRRNYFRVYSFYICRWNSTEACHVQYCIAIKHDQPCRDKAAVPCSKSTTQREKESDRLSCSCKKKTCAVCCQLFGKTVNCTFWIIWATTRVFFVQLVGKSNLKSIWQKFGKLVVGFFTW